MKNLTFIIAIAMSMVTLSFTSCQTSAQKEESARAKVEEANKNLNAVQDDANKDAQKAATTEEWKTFKAESQAKIKDNEARIAEFKVKMQKKGKALDELYEKKIENLEQKNANLRIRIEEYEKHQDKNWDAFKREFNHDMDELGQALKDFTKDNEK